MGQTVLIEAIYVNLAGLKVPNETLLLVNVYEVLNVRETGFCLETVNAPLHVKPEDHASHIKHYCLYHIKSLSGQIYVFMAEL